MTTAATPNHALQRTAPDCHRRCSHRLRPQPLFRSGCASPPPSLSLGSFGDSRASSMKTALLSVVLAFSLTGYLHASGAVTIEITTTDAGTSYTLHKQGYYADMAVATLPEIEAWLRGAIKQIGDREPVLIYADDRTPFRTVMDMLRRFKVAGVKRFAVCSGTGADVKPALSASFDDITLHRFDATPPPK